MTDSTPDDKLPAISQFEADDPIAFWMDEDVTARAWKVATRISNSQLVPEAYRGKPEDCLLALEMATRLRESPVAILQNLYIVKGKPMMNASFSIDRLNKSGLIEAPMRFVTEGKGDDLVVTAVCVRAQDGEEISVSASMAMAKHEGWSNPDKYGKSKYISMPEHMLSFRAGALLIRRHFPSVVFGLPISGGDPVVSPGGGSGNFRKRSTTRPSAAAAGLRPRTDEAEEAEDAEVIDDDSPTPKDAPGPPVAEAPKVQPESRVPKEDPIF
jgi:hypothetical protein